MTVKELIELLNYYDEDKEIRLVTTLGYGDDLHDFTFIAINDCEDDENIVYIYIKETKDGN